MRTNTIQAKYVHPNKLPKGCPKFDVIAIKMRNFGPDGMEFFMTPDEALYLSTCLSHAVFSSLLKDRSFKKRYIDARVIYAKKYIKKLKS